MIPLIIFYIEDFKKATNLNKKTHKNMVFMCFYKL